MRITLRPASAAAFFLAGSIATGLVAVPVVSSALAPGVATTPPKTSAYVGRYVLGSAGTLKFGSSTPRLVARTPVLPNGGAYSVHAVASLTLLRGANAGCFDVAIDPGTKSPNQNGSDSYDSNQIPTGQADMGHRDDRQIAIDDLVVGVKPGQQIGLYCLGGNRAAHQLASVGAGYIEAIPVGYHRVYTTH